MGGSPPDWAPDEPAIARHRNHDFERRIDELQTQLAVDFDRRVARVEKKLAADFERRVAEFEKRAANGNEAPEQADGAK